MKTEPPLHTVEVSSLAKIAAVGQPQVCQCEGGACPPSHERVLARTATSMMEQTLEEMPQNEDSEYWQFKTRSYLRKIAHDFLNSPRGHIEVTLFLARQPDPRFGVEGSVTKRARAGSQYKPII